MHYSLSCSVYCFTESHVLQVCKSWLYCSWFYSLLWVLYILMELFLSWNIKQIAHTITYMYFWAGFNRMVYRLYLFKQLGTALYDFFLFSFLFPFFLLCRKPHHSGERFSWYFHMMKNVDLAKDCSKWKSFYFCLNIFHYIEMPTFFCLREVKCINHLAENNFTLMYSYYIR